MQVRPYLVTKMLDPDNPSVADALAIPPKLLHEINSGNEEALSGAARVQLAYIMERMAQRCVDPQTSPSAVASIMEVLRKMATSQKDNANKSSGPEVIINITRARDRDDEGIVIEGKPAKRIVSDD